MTMSDIKGKINTVQSNSLNPTTLGSSEIGPIKQVVSPSMKNKFLRILLLFLFGYFELCGRKSDSLIIQFVLYHVLAKLKKSKVKR